MLTVALICWVTRVSSFRARDAALRSSTGVSDPESEERDGFCRIIIRSPQSSTATVAGRRKVESVGTSTKSIGVRILTAAAGTEGAMRALGGGKYAAAAAEVAAEVVTAGVLGSEYMELGVGGGGKRIVRSAALSPVALEGALGGGGYSMCKAVLDVAVELTGATGAVVPGGGGYREVSEAVDIEGVPSWLTCNTYIQTNIDNIDSSNES